MAIFVVDASVVLAWCFEDEATESTDNLLERVRLGDRCSAPAHWPIEVSNGMLMAVRRKRIAPGSPDLLWDRLSVLPIAVEPPLTSIQAKAVLAFSEQYHLTAYDAAYLDLASRKGVALATLDSALRRAAPTQGVPLIF